MHADRLAVCVRTTRRRVALCGVGGAGGGGECTLATRAHAICGEPALRFTSVGQPVRRSCVCVCVCVQNESADWHEACDKRHAAARHTCGMHFNLTIAFQVDPVARPLARLLPSFDDAMCRRNEHGVGLGLGLGLPPSIGVD